jgi:diguanylate cyclase (GGDEF)-like protein
MDNLTSFVGIAMQLGAALLFVGLFFVLQRENRRRTYFTVWSWAWVALALAVSALGLRDLLAFTHADWAGVSSNRALLFAYQWAKLLFGGLLLLGALLFEGDLRLSMRPAVAGVVAAAGVGAAAGSSVVSNLADTLAWLSPTMVLLFSFCSWKLLSVPPSRRGVGSRAVGVLFGVMGVVPVLYVIVGAETAKGTSPLRLLIIYLFLEVLLGCAMVVMRLEEEKREADDARTRLQLTHDRLRRATYTDVLTGALNRRAFAEGVGLEAAGAVRGAVALLDLDNLKMVNDSFGHAEGDTLLRELAEALRGGLRAADALYRWGGDEFLLVLPRAATDGARRRVEQALAVAAAEFTYAPPLLRPSVSVGVAPYSGAEELNLAIENADRDMYREKRRRKARTQAQTQARPSSQTPFDPYFLPPNHG